jgi:hypothetical protein
MPTGYMVPLPPVVAPNATVEANTADATLTVANFGKIQTNTGASGAVVLTLPAASTAAGCALKVQLTVAQIVRLTPATGEKIFLGGSGVASKYAAIAGVIGNFLDLFCDGVSYHVVNYSGVVTKEA